MTLLNRFIVFSKRIFTKKIYLLMLAFIIVTAGVYKLLPEKNKSADIKVVIYSKDTSEYTDILYDKLTNSNSLYNFYFTDSEENAVSDVKSGKAECGYVIPENFFNGYINGNTENRIVQHVIPSTTLAATINETIFSCIFEICANDILALGADVHEYDEELSDRLNNYMNSDVIFRISDITDGEFTFENIIYHINIPVYELILTLVIFSGLLGLLIYIQDSERGIYLSLRKSELTQIKSLSILTAILPILFTGLVSSLITEGISAKLINICIFSLFTFITVFLLGFIIKKSTLLTKVLPLIMLISVILIFVTNLI